MARGGLLLPRAIFAFVYSIGCVMVFSLRTNVRAVFTALFYMLLAVAMPHAGRAQMYKNRHFTTNEGLNSTTIYHLIQDRKGYIWIATDAGVARFDGQHFQNYYKENGLSDNDVVFLLNGTRGEVGFLTYNGEVSFAYENRIFNPENTPALRHLRFNYALRSGFEDSKGNIWFGIGDGSFYRFNRSNYSLTGRFPQQATPVSFFLEDSKGRIWLDGNRYLEHSTLKPPANRYTIFARNAFYNLPNHPNEAIFLAREGVVRMRDSVQTLIIPARRIPNVFQHPYGYLCQDAQGNIWMPTIGDGVYCFALDKNGTYTTPPQQFLKEKKVTSVLQDNEGNYWFGMLGDGLYFLPTNYADATTYTSSQGLRGDRVNAVCRDHKGNIWLGMDDANLCIIRGKDKVGSFIVRTHSPDPTNQNVTALYEDHKKCVWVLTPSSVVQFRPAGNDAWTQTEVPIKSKSSFTLKSWSLHQAAGSTEGIITHARGLLRLHKARNASGYELIPVEHLPSVPTYAGAFENPDAAATPNSVRGIWVANARGLGRLRGDTLTQFSRFDRRLNEKIKSIVYAPDNKTLLLAAEGKGLLFLRDTNIVYHFVGQDSLADNIYKRIFVRGNTPRDNYIWCTGNHGLARILFQNGTAGAHRIYYTSDGLASNEITDVFTDTTATYVATARGLTILGQGEQTNTAAPPRVYISAHEHFGLSDSLRETLAPFYSDSRVRIAFNAIAFRDPTAVIYQYRLLGGNTPWSKTDNNVVQFAKLPPGEYVFQVRARYAGGSWSAAESYRFAIAAYFWQTYAFWVIIALLALAGMYALIQNRLSRAQARQTARLRDEKKRVELEQQALQAMMNPHFIFNVMNSVQHFFNTNEGELANRYLTQFARLVRTNLEYSSKEFITLADEIAYLKLYFSLEQLRCGENLRYRILIHDPNQILDLDEIAIPPMVLQPFVENAIWHGIMPQPNGGEIILRIEPANNTTLRITITDDGIGIDNSRAQKARKAATHASPDPTAHHSLALTLTQERLRLLGQLTRRPVSLTIRQKNAEGGTVIEILMPLDW